MVLEVAGIGQLEFGPRIGFSFLLFRKRYISRRRRGGNVEIRRLCLLPDFQARWEEGETRFGFGSFPRFPRGVISTALSIWPLSERSDAKGTFVTASVFPLGAHFSFSAKIWPFPSKIWRQDRPGATIPRSLDIRDLPFWAQGFLPPRSLRIDSPRISMRWALCTSRSKMLSAKVGSPI
jgi:hypothetical protein